MINNKKPVNEIILDDMRKEVFLDLIDAGRKMGCDLDGDIIKGHYHHILNEAKEFGISLYFIINGKEAPELNINDPKLEEYIKRDIELTEKLFSTDTIINNPGLYDAHLALMQLKSLNNGCLSEIDERHTLRRNK